MEQVPPFSQKARSLKRGVYQHYKGNFYEVIEVARHSETLEEMVIYRALYGEQDVWVRPLSMFLETVLIKNQEVLRFKFIKNQDS
ncbi:MAG: DUF1653 domain-containing protein [Candidatus Pacebacteria bacterium]|nr:DUF1653 domain-containing protein [Candidatus Paceibacterota bacterium]